MLEARSIPHSKKHRKSRYSPKEMTEPGHSTVNKSHPAHRASSLLLGAQHLSVWQLGITRHLKKVSSMKDGYQNK